MKTNFKFACIYCGQHLTCDPRHSGRQILCPTCLHRIVIPPLNGQPPVQSDLVSRTWDTHIPLPSVETPAERRPASSFPVLAHHY